MTKQVQIGEALGNVIINPKVLFNRLFNENFHIDQGFDLLPMVDSLFLLGSIAFFGLIYRKMSINYRMIIMILLLQILGIFLLGNVYETRLYVPSFPLIIFLIIGYRNQYKVSL